jgi:hypothetical protein
LPSDLPGNEISTVLPGQYMQVQTQHSLQGTISRPYSVLPSLGWATDPTSQHHLDCLVKVQPNGRMSTHLAALSIGAILKVRGPFGRPFTLSDATKLNLLVAAGSGITPMLQWLHFLFSAPSCGGDGQTSEAKVAWMTGPAVALLYVNRAEDDIMARAQVCQPLLYAPYHHLLAGCAPIPVPRALSVVCSLLSALAQYES